MIQLREYMTILREIPLKCNAALLLEIEINKYKFKLRTIYVAARANKIEFVDTLDVCPESFTNSNGPVVICGELNVDILGVLINEATLTRFVDRSTNLQFSFENKQ